MPKYEIVLRGENFLLECEGQKAKRGFFASRFVEGETLEDAELAAVDLIREQLRDRVLNDRSDTPTMSMEGYNALASFENVDAPGDAFTFFRAVPKAPPAIRVSPPRWRRRRG